MEIKIDDLPEATMQDEFEGFFRSYYHKDILRAARDARESVPIDFAQVERYNYQLAENLLYNPMKAIPAAKRALAAIDLPQIGERIAIKPRFFNLSQDAQLDIRSLGSSHINRLIVVGGVVKKVTSIMPRLRIGAFECQRCGHVNMVDQGEYDILNKPTLCESCEQRSSYNLLDAHSFWASFQKLQIQENLEDLKGGESPEQISIYLEDDLVGGVNPGDKVDVCGVLTVLKGRKMHQSQASPMFKEIVEANNYELREREFEAIEITEKDEEEILDFSQREDIYNTIVGSIAPHIYGYTEIKEAVMYQLFSSPAIKLNDGSRVRGDSHVLLLGEPSTGKSEILQYVANNLSPKGVSVSGRSSTGAGLTASAVKDEFGEGGWSLEAGALVLADRGYVGIDEFDKMGSEDRSAIHDALEQQKVHVAKAGMVSSFNTRCTVLAAANPKYGRFDAYKALSEQVNLPPAIISRFDLIFFVKDDLSQTREVADHILETAQEPEKVEPGVKPEFIKKYIAYAHQNINPQISDEAKEKIKGFYVNMRNIAQETEDQEANDVPIPLTARQLWAIVRLARARARVRLSNMVEEKDAERVIELIKTSLKQAGVDLETGHVDVDRIYSDTSTSQRQKVKLVLQTIGKLERKYKTAKRGEIMEELGSKMSEDDIDWCITKLKEEGDVFEPRFEQYKIT